jgi:hypothetical protein
MIGYHEKWIQEHNQAQVMQDRGRVMDAGYGKSWNRFRVKKTMKNWLLSTVSPGTMDDL